MGWASGSRIFSEVIEVVQEEVADSNIRYALYDRLIDVFQDSADCDTLDECVGIDDAFDDAWHNRYPPDDLDE